MLKVLKFENLANVGDVIKAYDFMPVSDRPDMFMTGRVLEKGMIKHPVDGYEMFAGYTIEIIGMGEENRYEIGEIAYVPYEVSMIEYDERVELVATKAELEMITEEFEELFV
jgi:hypothetical protein